MRVLDDMCDILEGELKQIAKKDDLTSQDLDNAYKMVDIVKDIETIKAMKHAEEESRGYSNRYYNDSYDYSQEYSRDYSRDYSGRDNYSRNSYARRGRDGDGDGRYNESRDSMAGRDGGYSRHDNTEHLMQKIDEMQRKLDKMN